MTELQLIEVKSELGAGTRGASLGVDAIKIAAHDFASKFFVKLKGIEVPVRNELLYEPVRHPFARYIEGIHEVLDNVSKQVASSIKEGKFPIILAGDHSTAAGTIAGIKMAHPKKRLGVIWVDAHADLHSPYTTPSGNMHGMPLAMATAEDNLECKVNVPDSKTIGFWDKLKNLGGIQPKIQFEDLVFIAVRDVEPQENFLIQKHKIKNFTVTDVRKRGVEKVAFEALSNLDKCDIIYVSFDVDSMDPKVSMGTGTPVPNGINEREAGKLLQNLISSPKVVCFEMVEVNPTLDKENIMAETAFEILVKVANSISNQSIL
jgi:arginase